MSLGNFNRTVTKKRRDLFDRCAREQMLKRKGIPETVRMAVLDSSYLEEFRQLAVPVACDGAA